ncbi:glycosyltransferase [Fortiea contorta]|uniref:glycosyltransferase n=1 Tax=Fortiea contorta TaxID=1892405 RepID=UPI00034B3E81|nr:glycosyltransferase [Fortiea contorta]
MRKHKIKASKSRFSTSQTPIKQGIFQLRTATLILFGSVALFTAIIIGWFVGEATISAIFAQIDALQADPPSWVKVPNLAHEYLLIPTAGLLFTAFVVMKISPQPRIWSQRLVAGILIILTLRYVLWRSLSTLNLADPLTGVFSLGLFCLEILMLLKNIIPLLLIFRLKNRHREADIKSLAVIDGNFHPYIDIFIPTYDESAAILRRTIIGCQALDYAHKKIYVLDDTRRPEIQYLTKELGCEYITRPSNLHAKAGNLNHAIAQTNGDLIVVFDADFIPTKNFLTRTVGFFQDDKIALVQTPQSFYNADPIARNLGLENILTPDEEVFYRYTQPILDAAGSVVCAGTSFVVRRSAIEEIGGFVTESLSEDYFTGITLSAQGYEVIYLNEKLSAGLAAENIAAYVFQRLRWSQGTLQAFFIQSNPFTIPGLNFVQRLAHLEGIFHHLLASFCQIYFLLMPLVYVFLGVIPIQITLKEILYFLLPLYAFNLVLYTWLNQRSRSYFLSDIYSLFMSFPLIINVVQVMLNPFGKSFKVTPKGIVSHRYQYNWHLALPLIILFIATAISLWQSLCWCIVKVSWVTTTQYVTGMNLSWLWSGYNLLMITIALVILIDAPKPNTYEWFEWRKTVQLKVEEETLSGITTMISEIGAEVTLTQNVHMSISKNQPVCLEILEENLQLTGEVVRSNFDNKSPTLRIKFTSISLNQYRQLIEMLFCRPGQWRRHQVPSEPISLLLLFKILLKPRVLFNKKLDIIPMKISHK